MFFVCGVVCDLCVVWCVLVFESENVFYVLLFCCCVCVCALFGVRCCVGILLCCCVCAWLCVQGGVAVSSLLCFHAYFIPHGCSENKQK